jgi:hypothetical protein
MLLLYESAGRPEPPTADGRTAVEAHGAFIEECLERGAFVAADALLPVETATSVRVRDREALMTDGPFAETREWLGGYDLLECDDLDSALELASKCPVAEHGTVEVRPIDSQVEAQVARRRETYERRSADR